VRSKATSRRMLVIALCSTREERIVMQLYSAAVALLQPSFAPRLAPAPFSPLASLAAQSAILAAVQICLGAGARRTNRAKTLSKLINNHGNATHAKLQVKLLNKGSDSFQHEIYGDFITVERILDKTGGSTYRLLDEDDKVKSKKKADLDAMLDLFNIQVDNPVAVLDQEESKKFLKGRPEDKYAFFCKATELERIDRHYAITKDHIEDLDESRVDLVKQLRPQRDVVQKLEAEWEECQKLEVRLEGEGWDEGGELLFI